MRILLSPPATYAARCLALAVGGYFAFASRDFGTLLLMGPVDLLVGLLLFRRDYLVRRGEWIVAELRFRHLFTTVGGRIELLFALLFTLAIVVISPWAGSFPVVLVGLLLLGTAFLDLRRRVRS